MSTPIKEYQHYQCDPVWVNVFPLMKGRGITTWNTGNHQYTIPPLAPNESTTLTFTCTVPKCYSNYNIRDSHPIQGRDNCLIVFNAYAKDNNTPDGIDLKYTLNGKNCDGCRISGVAGNGGTQTFDIGQPDLHATYDDMTKNTLTITNKSNNSTVQIDHFKIYRVYQMCNLNADSGGGCVTSVNPICTPTCEMECQMNQIDKIGCMEDSPSIATGNLDTLRIDTPCNYDTHGGLSFSQYHDETYKQETEHTILPGQSHQWTFNFDRKDIYGQSFIGNYAGENVCFFNFNQTQTVGTATTPDVPVVALLNGHTINTYYLSKTPVNYDTVPTGMFLSHDLATSQYYDAWGSNTVTLKNVSGATIRMIEAIDVYRIFQTNPVYDIGCIQCYNVCNSSCQNVCYAAAMDCQNCYNTCEECYTSCNDCQECYNTCEECYNSCNDCQVGCEISCQGCNIGCNTGCQVDCQTGCQVDCQDGCELSCQGCYSCAGGCYVSCQYSCVTCDACYSFCQTCDTCQGCYGCQTGCQICQTCETNCQNCQTCQNCENCYSCENDCYDCQNCQYNYTNYNTQPNNNQQPQQPQQQPPNNQTPTTTATANTKPTTQQNTTTNPQNNPNNNRKRRTQNPNNNPNNRPNNPNNNRTQNPNNNLNNRPNNPNNNRTQNPNNNLNNRPNNNPTTISETQQNPNTQNQNPNLNTPTKLSPQSTAPPPLAVNDEHIKEVLLDALIELDLIKQPQKRRQMTNDPK